MSEAGAYARWVKRQDRRIAFLGINTVDDLPRARSFQRRHGWSWPSLRDRARTRALRLGADYQPAFILVDARGRIVDGFQDDGTPARWNALVRQLP